MEGSVISWIAKSSPPSHAYTDKKGDPEGSRNSLTQLGQP
jgi:hypothetical protein